MSDADRAMLAEFVAAIAEQRAPSVTRMDGYRALEVVIADYHSVEQGEPVVLVRESDR